MNSNTPTAPASKLRVKRADYYDYDPAYHALTQAEVYHHCWLRAVRWKAPKGYRAELRCRMREYAMLAVRGARVRVQIRAELDAKYPISARAA